MNLKTFLTLMAHLRKIGVCLKFIGPYKVALVAGDASEEYELWRCGDVLALVDPYCKEVVLVARPGEVSDASATHIHKY